MPDIEVAGARIWYTVDGSDRAPSLLLIHSLGTTHELWEPQMPALAKRFRVIRYDVRGHGRSPAPPGDYSIDELGREAVAVLDAANAPRAAVAGVSLGGVIAVWLGANAGERVRQLVLANTGARIGTPETWSTRMRAVSEGGMEAAADLAMPRWFTDAFRKEHPDVIARFHSIVLACPAAAYLGACAALRDADLREDARRITTPTLVIAGRQDQSTPLANAELLRDRIAGARLELLDAAHLSNVERAEEFNALLADFLS
jgi:3-oxoadipate enol-lactonase